MPAIRHRESVSSALTEIQERLSGFLFLHFVMFFTGGLLVWFILLFQMQAFLSK